MEEISGGLYLYLLEAAIANINICSPVCQMFSSNADRMQPDDPANGEFNRRGARRGQASQLAHAAQ